MTSKHIAPYGSWPSPISPADVVARSTDLRHGLGQMCLDGDYLYWIEGRPQEGARNVVARIALTARTRNELEQASPAGVSVRTRVNEYGGGDFTVSSGRVFYVDQSDQRVYAFVPGSTRPPQPLTIAARRRYADLQPDLTRNRLLAIQEDHTGTGEPVQSLVAIDPGAGRLDVLARGADFYAAPALSPDGKRLAWLQWQHPNMPWDGCELWLAEVGPDGRLHGATRLAGGAQESIFQPSWSPDGILHFVSDRTGWANLYRWEGETTAAIAAMEAEFSAPLWNLGTTTYGFAGRDRIVAAYALEGIWYLAEIDRRTGSRRDIAVDHTEIAQVRVAGEQVFFRGGSPTQPPCLVALDLASGASTVLRESMLSGLVAADISAPESVRFPSGEASVHAFFYPPTNVRCAAPTTEKPPLIVVGHGGPTAAASTALDLKVQFWTSRGFAVVDVNYRGSTGFGRAYRESLNGLWGLADVEDCVAAARFLAARGDVDPARLLIRGSSAGGFTCLSALVFHDVFRAGASYYGISDLEALARETHKFESHYTDSLVGPYPAARARYRERSPIHAVDRLDRPLIVFQGLRDEVVPPSQAEKLVAALRAKRLPVAYVTFSEEGHGFRDVRNSRRALESELYFYARILGFTPADDLTPVAIENL